MELKTNSRGNSVCILGGGSWGTAMAILLARKGYPVTVWEFQKDIVESMQKFRENRVFLPGIKLPDNVTVTNYIEDAVPEGEYIIFAVPSHVFRSVSKQAAAFLMKGRKFISATKGIENYSLMRMSEILLAGIPGLTADRVAVLSGPSFAAEVAREIPTAVVAASSDESYAAEVQELFMCPAFRVYVNTDVTGVELGGAFKNVMAIATGIADGVGFGDNSKAALLTRGIVEMTRLGVKMGAGEKTFAGLSGMGDLVLTCMGKLSRNLYVGQELGKGRKLQEILDDMVMVAEGVNTARSIRKLALTYGVETPIMEQVYRILFEDKNPKEAVVELMTREPKPEV
ncbi:glycerol-3-phosphate dehydrogenase [bacterium SM23_31]|nr:MAG: glycerol-3-phosphate dehydrogenase [bacterium SM23_31]